MRKLIKKLIDKYIVKILIIYNKGKEKVLFCDDKNYLVDTIYFATQHLIRLIKESREENERRSR